MGIQTILKIKSKTNNGFAARIIVKKLIENNKVVISIEKRFLSNTIPYNVGYIKRGNLYYCVQSMSFKEETFNQIIQSYETYNYPSI